MCGRYTLRKINLARAALEAMPRLPFDEFSERPRFNVAPSQIVPIVRLDTNGNRILTAARWGFIPAWAGPAPKATPINARAESIATSPMFRPAFGSRRCLVPADGFYEWKGAKPPKQPYFIHFKNDDVFAFAGLWERSSPQKDAEPIETFTIITTDPNQVAKPIHNRMPVILRRADYAGWLEPRTPISDLKKLMQPYEADGMEAYAVSLAVNSPKNDDERCVKPNLSSSLF